MAIALITYVAEAVPFNNVGTDYKAENVRDALLENDFRSATKEPTGIADITQSTIAFDNLTRTFTITPVGAEYYYYVQGEKFVVTVAASIQIPDTQGQWFFYFNNAGALIASQTEWTFEDPIAFVAIVLWSAVDQEAIYLGEERHGIVMPWATHKRFHYAGGAQIGSRQFTIGDTSINGDGSLDAHATFSLTDGILYDEDIANVITQATTPANYGEQNLSPIAQLPMYYKSGVNGEWRKLASNDFAIVGDSPNTPFFNEWTGTTWQLTNIPSESYAATVIGVTNNVYEPVIGIVPQFHDTNAVDATRGVIDNIDLTGVPFLEVFFLVLGIYEVNLAFTNSVKARYVAFSGPEGLEEQVDRYAVLANYNGNANTGRYLEVIPGVGSDTAPFFVPDDSYVRTVTLQSSAVDTFTLGFFEVADLVNPRLEVTITNAKEAFFDVSTLFVAGEQVALRITSGNSSSPAARFWLQTTIGV